MLNKSNIIVLVGLKIFDDFSPNKITIWDTSRNNVLCHSYPFSSKIIFTKINRDRLIIGEENLLHIYSTDGLKCLKSLAISNMALGNFVISSKSDKNVWLCFSTPEAEGVVKVYDALNLTS